LFKQRKLNFQDFQIEELPESTQQYLLAWVKYFKRDAKLHTPIFMDTYVFLISHPIVKYLIHDPIDKEHQWGDKNFENLNNNQALVLMSASAKNTPIPPDDLKDAFDYIDKISKGENDR
jgi:hypothetical protein